MVGANATATARRRTKGTSTNVARRRRRERLRGDAGEAMRVLSREAGIARDRKSGAGTGRTSGRGLRENGHGRATLRTGRPGQRGPQACQARGGEPGVSRKGERRAAVDTGAGFAGMLSFWRPNHVAIFLSWCESVVPDSRRADPHGLASRRGRGGRLRYLRLRIRAGGAADGGREGALAGRGCAARAGRDGS
jgi:hypothetical protein